MTVGEYLNSGNHTALTSIGGALLGTATPESAHIVNEILQRGAWTVAIVAGCFSIANYCFKITQKYKNLKK